MSDTVRVHYDLQAPCLVVDVEDEHLGPGRAVVRLTHFLIDDSANYTDYSLAFNASGLRDLLDDLYSALARLEAPTEGETDDDTTDQGSPGGETAADDDRAGADSREVGAVVSEVPPAAEEGGVGEPSADAPHGPGTVRALFESVIQYAKTEDERELIDLAFRTAFQLHPDYWDDFDVRLVRPFDTPRDSTRCSYVFPPESIQCVRSAPRGRTLCAEHGR